MSPGAVRLEELCEAVVRALSGDPGARGGLDVTDAGSARGVADGRGLRLGLSDPELYGRLRPDGAVERLVFEMLEQFRVEACAPGAMPGLVRNLRHRHERWALASHHDGLTETARGLLLYTVAQVCRSRITGEPVVAETEDLIEATRAALAPRLGGDLAGLRRHRGDQALFARHARSVAAEVAGMLHGTEDEEQDEGASGLAVLLDQMPDLGHEAVGVAAGGAGRAVAPGSGYRVFTTAYDRERPAAGLVRAEVRGELRERLDGCVARRGVNLGRVVRELTAALAAPTPDGWDGGQEEGYLDGRALARLVSSPLDHRVFRLPRTEPAADALVTFLIDCSGSMKRHAEAVAVLVDVFARALDLAGARCEVLGFTTGAWHGGRARRDWLRAGRPRHPGRLNERLHLVFKDAETPWRRARRDIAALLKPDLFREGVDGEALAWAAARARSRDERRRLLFVLSDGSPADGATALANGERYLDRHLRHVVAGLERDGSLEVYGLGVGLDLSPYYRHRRALDTDSGPGVFREVLDLVARR
ncbi:cobaltochelatase CobT-related protein [Pseudonocardia acaciae]|uniref:cobaltochelatase CobT-related protein n=1 Tax=Pseudonocardia acaciae TaxID=551276 RepID=UPI00068734DD|nr:cobalt chelatase [Pseudonocardia acaciae]